MGFYSFAATDSTSKGPVAGRQIDLVKTSSRTRLHIIFDDMMMVQGERAACRWSIRINGNDMRSVCPSLCTCMFMRMFMRMFMGMLGMCIGMHVYGHVYGHVYRHVYRQYMCPGLCTGMCIDVDKDM